MKPIAGYPTRALGVQCGDLALRLLTVKRLEDYVDSDALLRDSEAPEPPYWAHVWPGSRALARLVATDIDCAGRRLIDIGCGLGLAAIAAARRGADVSAIDRVYAAIRFTLANAAQNQCHVHAVQTDIAAPGIRGVFDYCLAADVTYDPTLQLGLADFLDAHLSADGRAWIAESVRTFDHGFHDACRKHGFVVAERELREADDGRNVVVRVTEIHRSTGRPTSP